MSNLIKNTNNHLENIDNDDDFKVGTFYYSRSTSYGFTIYEIISIIDDNYVLMKDEEGNEKQKSKSDLEQYYVKSSYVDINELKDFSNKVLSGEMSLDQFDFNEKNESTDIVLLDSDAYYIQQKELLSNMKDKVAIIEGLMINKINSIKDNLRGLTKNLKQQIKKLDGIIFTLSIYAGLSENVIQISIGENANEDEPIHLIQKMKFMDEEVGDPENGGISYDSVDKFYEWMRKDNKHLGYKNFKLLLPYEKSICLFRVRRNISEKYVTSDPFENRYEKMEEMKTCIIFRNGENVYVIHSDMEFNTRMFPDQDEFAKLIENINGNSTFYKEESDDKLNSYRNGMVLIQGIFDRTDFMVRPGSVRILNGDDLNNGKIIFDYTRKELDVDDDLSKFRSWVKSGQNVEEGSYILFYKFGYGDVVKHRVTKYYQSDYNVPKGPSSNILVKIENYKEYGNNHLTFLYLPSESYFSFKGRTKRERVKFLPLEDSFINVSLISEREYDFLTNLMYDRRYRNDYLWMVGLMNDIKQYINEINEKEVHFGSLIKKEFPELDIKIIMNYIFWWKNKNKWKRPLTEDDAKAYRMIIKKIKSDQKNNVTYEPELIFYDKNPL